MAGSPSAQCEGMASPIHPPAETPDVFSASPTQGLRSIIGQPIGFLEVRALTWPKFSMV